MDDILNNPNFQKALDNLARQTGIPADQVRREAEADLKEMAARPGKITVAGWDRFCRWLARAYSLDVDDKAIDELKELNKDSSLVFLPNHRSYLDPLVLRSALGRHGFPPNNVLGGVNLALWPLSDIGQRNGIVFIRREFRNDPVYRAVLRAYLSYLIEKRHNLEWYIEGGRTRTGKLRPPRYGILSYLIDAYSAHPQHDVKIVPTSIIYDQQHEVGAISAEEAGSDKSPESLKWVYEFAKSQSRRLGRAHLRFGEPLSLEQAISLTEGENGQLRPRLAVPKVAFEVANRINAATPITPTALVTFALLDNEDRAITVGEGREILGPLLDYIGLRKLPITAHVDMSRRGELRNSIERLLTEGVISMYDGGLEPVFVIPRDKQHEAAFYRNTIIHFFVTRAITELALLDASHLEADESSDADRASDAQASSDLGVAQRDPIPGGPVINDAWERAKRLKDILKFEFFFSGTKEFAGDIAAESSLVVPGWEKQEWTRPEMLERIRGLKLHLAHRVLAPFLEAYSVAFEQLAQRHPAVEIDEEKLVLECMGIAQQRWLQHLLHSPESISRDLFRNALKLADNYNLLEPGGPEVQQRRAEVAAELRGYVDRVSEIRRLARERAREYLRTADPFEAGL